MRKGCIFVGGVHGSGKTTLCERIQKELNCHYISASKLLNWKKIEKNVEDITANQQILKKLLKEKIRGEECYLIDGHFALWNNQFQCEKVSVDFFYELNIISIIFVKEEHAVVRERIVSKTKMNVSMDDVIRLSKAEYDQARCVAEKLGVPIYEVSPSNVGEINLLINNEV